MTTAPRQQNRGPALKFTSAELAEVHLEAQEAGVDLPDDIGLLLSADPHANVRADDPMSNYMQRLKHLEPLDADTQFELASTYYEDDTAEWAARLLVVTNLRLVVKIAQEYKKRGSANLFELIQQGNMGLSEAITRFDPSRGVRFISYAQYWIRAMILRHLMNQLYPVRFGNTRAGRKIFYNLRKARRALRRKGHENPTPQQVADYLDVDRDEVVRISAQMDAPPVAIDGPAPGHEGVTVGEMMPADTSAPEDDVMESELRRDLTEAFEDFREEELNDERDLDIWDRRMVSEESLTLRELGATWDVSKERIRQVEADIQERFGIYLRNRFGDEIEVQVQEMMS